MRKRGVPGIATLFIALGAAALAAGATFVICRVHYARVRASLEVRQVKLLKYTRSMAAGGKIDRRDLEVTIIRKDDAKALANVVGSGSRNFLIGRRLRQSVVRGQWVQWAHVRGDERATFPRIREGMVAMPLDLDPRTSPGVLCRPGDRVNVLAPFQLAEGAPLRIFRIIRNVKVLATGSSAEAIPRTRPEPGIDGAYRSVTIEVSPEVALPLHKLLKLAKGSAWLEVLPPDAPLDPKRDGIINPDEPILKRLAEPEGQGCASPGPTTRGEPKDARPLEPPRTDDRLRERRSVLDDL